MSDEFLAEVLEELKKRQRPTITVRELISKWGAQSRGSRVVHRIHRSLEAHGLRTVPEFDQVGLDALVTLERRPKNAAKPRSHDYTLNVGALPSASGGVISVPAGTSLQATHTTMQLHDYSQLAVMSGRRELQGAVTWASIAQALLRNPEAELHHCTIRATVVDFDDDLLRLAATIVKEEFVLVRDQTKSIGGIVTTADVSRLFAERSEAFLQIGEIDQRIRDTIAQHISIDQVRELCRRAEGSQPLEEYDDMSMGDYQTVLGNPGCWAQIGWALDRSVVLKALDTVRTVRNDVMHFNPDPPSPEDLEIVSGLLSVLRKNA